MRTKLELIAPMPRLSASNLEKTFNNFLDEIAQAMQADYYVTVATWKHKVDFIINDYKEFGREIFTWDDKYMFVNDGTRIRYATMTPNFSAKSRPGSIGSVPGSGGVAFISKKHPRPGIKARSFNLAINIKWEKQYGAQWDRALTQTAPAWE